MKSFFFSWEINRCSHEALFYQKIVALFSSKIDQRGDYIEVWASVPMTSPAFHLLAAMKILLLTGVMVFWRLSAAQMLRLSCISLVSPWLASLSFGPWLAGIFSFQGQLMPLLQTVQYLCGAICWEIIFYGFLVLKPYEQRPNPLSFWIMFSWMFV